MKKWFLLSNEKWIIVRKGYKKPKNEEILFSQNKKIVSITEITIALPFILQVFGTIMTDHSLKSICKEWNETIHIDSILTYALEKSQISPK